MTTRFGPVPFGRSDQREVAQGRECASVGIAEQDQLTAANRRDCHTSILGRDTGPHERLPLRTCLKLLSVCPLPALVEHCRIDS